MSYNRIRQDPAVHEGRPWRLVSAIGLCDSSKETADEFLGGCVPFVGAEEATQFQACGTVCAGQQYGRAALGVLFADDFRDDGEEPVAHALRGPDYCGRVRCR